MRADLLCVFPSSGVLSGCGIQRRRWGSRSSDRWTSRSLCQRRSGCPAPAARSIRAERGGRDHSSADRQRRAQRGAGRRGGGEEARFLDHTIRGAARGCAPAAAEGEEGAFCRPWWEGVSSMNAVLFIYLFILEIAISPVSPLLNSSPGERKK